MGKRKSRKGGARPGAGRPPGIPNPNAGPLPTHYVVVIGSTSREASFTRADIPILRCNQCGAMWHESYDQITLDLGGMIIGHSKTKGESDWHKEGCPLREE